MISTSPCLMLDKCLTMESEKKKQEILPIENGNKETSYDGEAMRTVDPSSPKRLFAECALVEIIHLHDCLRNALHQIQNEVNSLVQVSAVIDDNDGSTNQVSSDNKDESDAFDIEKASELSNLVASRFHLIWSVFQAHSGAEDEFIWPALKMKIESKKKSSNGDCPTSPTASTSDTASVASCTPSTPPKKCGCESFLEQEAYEEDHAEEETMFKQINTTIRRLNGSFRYYHANPQSSALSIIKRVILILKEQTDNIIQHLEVHLTKEETQCLPMVKKHLNNDEISTLVGQIMGKRSAEMMGKILNLAVCSLPGDEREDMVKCLKKAMGGTFFEKWLTMGGWSDESAVGGGIRSSNSWTDLKKAERKLSGDNSESNESVTRKRKYSDSNPSKPTKKIDCFVGHIEDTRLRPPSKYYVKDGDDVKMIWNCAEAKGKNVDASEDVPLFAQSELIPSYTFSETKGCMVLGCRHYARSCKLRHPETGQLFTCRVCCEDVRQNTKGAYEALPILERHDVTEILCMKCGALQPAGPKCVNDECESKGELFAKHQCSICNLYDNDENREIYHCPFCNVCRKGKGLGIDFRHCMRCNACISINEYDTHVCISQRLQGNCPICHESMFESTEPLRGMKCGHVMHLSCFERYASRCMERIPCPICKQSFENMRG